MIALSVDPMFLQPWNTRDHMTHTISMYSLTNLQLWIFQFPPLMFPFFFDIHTPLPLILVFLLKMFTLINPTF